MTGALRPTPLQQDPTDLREYGWYWFQDVINRTIDAFRAKLLDAYGDLSGTLETGTPVPGQGLGDPSQMFSGSGLDAPWEAIYEGTVPSGGVPEMFALSLMVLMGAVQARHLSQIFSSGTAYQAHKTRKSAWVGGALILVWYWLAVMALSLVDVIHVGVVEQLLGDELTFAETLRTAVQSIDTESANRAWLFPVFALAAVGMWTVEAVLYLRYHLLLPIFVYVMPVLIAMVYGNVPVVDGIARTLIEKALSLLVLPIPLVLLMWGYETVVADRLLGGAFENAVLAASFPVVAAYVVWKVMTYEYPSGERIAAAAATAGTAIGSAVGSATAYGPQVATQRAPTDAPPEPVAESSEEDRPSFRRAPPHEHW